MKFLKKLFARATFGMVENTKLNRLLYAWQLRPSNSTYNAVMLELLAGTSFLLLPSTSNSKSSGGWQTSEPGDTLQLSSLFILDGIKALGAFTTENFLFSWSSDNQTPYTIMRAQDVFTICQQNNIDRIVINSGQQGMFVLDRNYEALDSNKKQQPIKVLIGTPVNSLADELINKLLAVFPLETNIEEAYQYGQFKNEHAGLVIGVKLSEMSVQAKTAALNTIQSALEGEVIEQNLEVVILETEEWLSSVRKVENALFYKRLY